MIIVIAAAVIGALSSLGVIGLVKDLKEKTKSKK
jgi:hypothetical protein